jgi:hypothetical protein
MDAIVGKCLNLIDTNTIVVLATALSQQPCLKYEETGGKVFYRPEQPIDLLRFSGISSSPEYAPVMSEQFHLYFPSEAAASDAQEKLLQLCWAERPVMMARAQGKEVFAGCAVFERVPLDAIVRNGDGLTRKFYELFYNCSLVKSGMHHPDGILWVSTPDRTYQVEEEKVSLRAIAPTLLALLGYPVPDFMEMPALPTFDFGVESTAGSALH